ncbi:DUF2516 family protein [Janibacter sp. YIM B02568]|uniref:DUF2516 family protein n=1 Tax=Janibacter endophyticus TaxID=2806261 RepID=UPI001951FA40|nr:DUF2516 family protein [Janibacter endophyticus]MBM6545262.1 DUF2516 family protein [Janibacter endophyticus]
MSVIANIQQLIVLVLGAIAVGVELYALVHAATQRADAFVAAGKLTKPVWLGILAVGLLLGIASFGGLGLLGLLGVVAAGVYLADVKPAIAQVLGRSNDNRWGR